MDTNRAIADAILYEGYLIYPYRKPAVPNRQRWNFAGLFPKFYADRRGEHWSMRCQCLLQGNAESKIAVDLRFLRITSRKIAKLRVPAPRFDPQAEFEFVDQHLIRERRFLPWEEAIEAECEMMPLRVGDLIETPFVADFRHDAETSYEPLANEDGLIGGLIVRQTERVWNSVALSAEPVAGGIYKLSLQIGNKTVMLDDMCASRDLAAPFAMAAPHAILTTGNGRFLSLANPPQDLRPAALGCLNEGCWPVLIGNEDSLLVSPTLLQDHPSAVPRLGTSEIDEILALRALTMSGGERAEIAAGDSRLRALLERLESMSPEEFAKLYRAWRARTPRPEPVVLPAKPDGLAVGERVRLRPRHGGDIMDIALTGRLALIEAIERDFDNRVHVAVVLEEDAALSHLPGHRFFFAPEEIERLDGGATP